MAHKDDNARRRDGDEEDGDLIEGSLDGVLNEDEDADEDSEETVGLEDEKWE